MLVEFSTANNRSFREKATLSLIAGSIKDLGNEAIINLDRIKLLKGAVIYGANASGKSNILNSIAQMRWLVVNSSKETQAKEPLGIKPYLLDDFSREEPTMFEMVFIVDQIKYRYGFEANNERITAEWLFETEKIKEKPLFVRENDEIQLVDRFEEGYRLESKTRPNALFISVVSQFNGEISTRVISWFQNLNMVHGIHDKEYFGFTAQMLENEDTGKLVLNFIKEADLGIKNMKLTEFEKNIDGFEEMLSVQGKEKFKDIIEGFKTEKLVDVITFHDKYNYKGEVIGEEKFSLADHESQGTNKFFNIIGAIIDVLINGEVLVIDELNARLHPLLTRKIVEIFNSSIGNPNNAQLIFTTHDTNLLDKDILRRDQIYFTEKDSYGSSHLYSLVEYKNKPRNDEAYERNYIGGKYGAIPFIGDFYDLLSEQLN